MVVVNEYLCCLGVLLQLVQLCVAGLEEALEDRVVVETALPPDQLHALPKLLHVQQHVLKGHWTHK